ncbi:hypothetical protein GOODEAATRI_014095 [Goodea atripinnis]|uniref:FHA domain-containing protein n=1 Tax=Goodea atripinnis TaxID=208336 RepID=A0ABV0PYE8_9TELE
MSVDMLELLPVFCSTNGTVINLSKVVKKQTHVLQNGDVIYFVYRKSEPEQRKDSDLGSAQAVCTEMAGSAKGGPWPKPPVDETKTDKMEESLTCVICQDLLHDCIR